MPEPDATSPNPPAAAPERSIGATELLAQTAPLLPSADTDAEAAPSVIGPYCIIGLLGRGGMGVVYRAEDPRLKREVALKVMLPAFAANPQAKARFVREARAQAKVEHDHVAAIFQVDEHAGLPFLVMPLLKGMTLYAALRGNPRPPLSEVIRIGREVAEGLAAAHEQGLVHRDIKPANIWLEGKRLRVKILDFGLARATSESDVAIRGAQPTADTDAAVTRVGAVVGTPAYMSPEQSRGEPVDARTDLWSLGVILYQMTTGQLPFIGSNAGLTLSLIKSTHPAPPCDRNPSVPPGVSDLVMRLLSKDPATRPASAEALVEALRAIELGLVNSVRAIPLDGAPPLILPASEPDPFAQIDATEVITTPSTPTTRRAGSVSGRSPFPVWAVAAAVVLAVAGLVWVLVNQLGKKPTAELVKDPGNPSRPAGGSRPGVGAKPPERPTARLVRRTLLPQGAWDVAVSSDATTVAVACNDSKVHLLDPRTGDRLKSLEGHTDRVLSVAFSRDGVLASGSLDKTIRIWNIKSGKTTHTLQAGAECWVVAFSPDGQTLIGGGNRAWDVGTGQPTLTLADGNRNAIAFVPGKGQVIVGDYHTGIVQILDTTTGASVRKLANWGAGVRGFSLSPDGTRLAVAFGRNNPPTELPIPGDDYSVRILDLATGEVIHRMDGHKYVAARVQYSRDGSWLLSVGHDGTARAWDAATGKERYVMELEERQIWGSVLLGTRTAITTDSIGAVTFWELPPSTDLDR